MTNKSTKKLTTQDFVARATLVHNMKYDYSQVVYVNKKTKVKIICVLHGIFEQLPHNHMAGFGCSKCSGKTQSNTLDFVGKANKIHNNLYDYSRTNYTKALAKVEIICKIHGSFWQKPNKHLSGDGCPKCNNSFKLAIEDFISKANTIHNYKYDYSLAKYSNNRTKIVIICKTHGEFKQTPDSHLQNHGCPACAKVISNIEIQWLDSLNIPTKFRQKTIKINNKTYKLDAYNPINNTIYEFYGDFWHGNPIIYSPTSVNKASKKTFGELHQKTIDKERALIAAGYNIISIWENDWKEQCKQHVLSA